MNENEYSIKTLSDVNNINITNRNLDNEIDVNSGKTYFVGEKMLNIQEEYDLAVLRHEILKSKTQEIVAANILSETKKKATISAIEAGVLVSPSVVKSSESLISLKTRLEKYKMLFKIYLDRRKVINSKLTLMELSKQ